MDFAEGIVLQHEESTRRHSSQPGLAALEMIWPLVTTSDSKSNRANDQLYRLRKSKHEAHTSCTHVHKSSKEFRGRNKQGDLKSDSTGLRHYHESMTINLPGNGLLSR